MSDEQELRPADPAADEPAVDPSGNVLTFHVGDVRQAVAVPPTPRLRVPGPRPAFGTDDEGNPRPDPTLAAPEDAPVAAPKAVTKPDQGRAPSAGRPATAPD